MIETLDKTINIKGPLNWYYESLNDDSDILCIAFSSNSGKFEWSNTFECNFTHLKFKKIYVIDAWKVWWNGVYRSLDGHGFKVLENFLRGKIEENNIKKVFTIGASIGGYGAILFGCLLNVDLVLAFSPQTMIDDRLDEIHSISSRFKMIQDQVNPNCKMDTESTNLNKILTSYGQENKTEYKVFYGIENEYDVKHAYNISSFKGVNLFPLKTYSHATARISLKNGTVEKLIRNFIGDNI